MPTIIRKSDGQVFDVYGIRLSSVGIIMGFLIWERGWKVRDLEDFEPTHEHVGRAFVQERELDIDPDLQAM
jgi:hypothetical protein